MTVRFESKNLKANTSIDGDSTFIKVMRTKADETDEAGCTETMI